MKPEIAVLAITPEFDTPPKGVLKLTIGAKGKTGQTERTIQFLFDGTESCPKLEDVVPQPPLSTHN